MHDKVEGYQFFFSTCIDKLDIGDVMPKLSGNRTYSTRIIHSYPNCLDTRWI